jgi:GDSL-like Lipase/Acylhydrolase family
VAQGSTQYRARAIFGNGLVALTGLAFSLLVIEIVFRVFDFFPPPPLSIQPPRPDLFQADEKVGYRLWKSARMCERYPLDSPDVIPIISNSDGFRSSREYDEPDPRRRILVVGDSFVYGSGVREEERFTDVLETLEPAWRVDSLGMPGWGLDLMIRGLDRVGLKAHPSVVILAVYTDDFRRLLPYYSGMGYPYDKFELVDGRLETKPYPRASGWRRLRIIHALYETYWLRQRFRNRYDLNEALLDRFLELADQHYFEPVVLFLPGVTDSSEDQARRRFLQNWAATRNVPYLDLTNPIHRAGARQTYIHSDFHWNAKGHRIAATALLHFLKHTFGTPLQKPASQP